VKPQTYMNLSGESVSCLLAKQAQGSDASSLIVISDDLALHLADKDQAERSAGGHNGLKVDNIGDKKRMNSFDLESGFCRNTRSGIRRILYWVSFRSRSGSASTSFKKSVSALRTILKVGRRSSDAVLIIVRSAEHLFLKLRRG